MSEQYAGLSLGVDITQVNNAIKSLKQFKQASHDAADGVQDFIDSEQVAKQKAKDLANELTRQRKEFQDVQRAIDPTAAKMDRLRKSAAQLDQLWKKGIVPDETFFQLSEVIETQSNKLATARKALTEEGRAALEESKQKAKAVAEGKRFVEALQAQAAAAGKTQSELMEMKAAQLGVTAQAAPFIQQLKQQEKQVEKLGISMGQYRQAVRMLPAQITDVTTSLASGMPIWLVAIQQGGQIKDSFGGIVPMFRALVKWLSPLKVGLGAVAGVLGYMTVGAYNSKKELAAITDTIKDATGVSDDFAKKIATVVQDLANVSGKSADDIAKAYVSTKDSASDAVSKLVEVGYSYQEATELVRQYKNTSDFTGVNQAIAENQQKVADLQRSWLDVAAARLKAMGSVLIGDPQGKYAGKKDTRRETNLERSLGIMSDYHDINTKKAEEYNKKLAEAAAEVDKQNLSLNHVRAAQERLNEAIKRQQLLEKGGTEEDKKRAAENVALLKKEVEEAKKAGKEKAKARTSGAGKVVSEQLDKELYVLEAQLKTLKEHRTVNDVISSQRKSLWSIEKQIEILQEAQSKRALTEGEKRLLLENKTVLEMARQKAELGDQIVLQERSNKLHQNSISFIRQVSSEIDALNLKQQGMTERQIQRQLELQKIENDYIKGGGKKDDQDLADMLAKRKEFYAQEDSLRMDWLAGAKEAWNQYGEDATNMYENVGQIASQGLNGLSDLMTEFLTTGKASFKDFASSIIKMIVEMITKMAIFNAMSSVFGGGKGTFTIGSLMKGFSGGGYTGDGGKYDPAGVVHKGEFVFTKEATQRIGARNLYRLMRGYANGGVAGGTTYSGGGMGGAGNQFNISGIEVNVNNGSDPKGLENGIKMIVSRMLRESCTQGGEVFEFVTSKTR